MSFLLCLCSSEGRVTAWLDAVIRAERLIDYEISMTGLTRRILTSEDMKYHIFELRIKI